MTKTVLEHIVAASEELQAARDKTKSDKLARLIRELEASTFTAAEMRKAEADALGSFAQAEKLLNDHGEQLSDKTQEEILERLEDLTERFDYFPDEVSTGDQS